MFIRRIKAYRQRRRTRKMMKQMEKAGREAADRITAATQNVTAAFDAFAKGFNEGNITGRSGDDET